jgi:hypothetical protein
MRCRVGRYSSDLCDPIFAREDKEKELIGFKKQSIKK